MILGIVLSLALAQTGPAWPSLTVRWVVPIDDKQRVAGREVQLTRLSVAESPQEVLARFAASFERASLYIPPPRDQLQLYAGRTSLTALDPRTMTTFTVTVWKAEVSGSQILAASTAAVGPLPPQPGPGSELLPISATDMFCTRDEGHATCSFASREPIDAVQRQMEAAAERSGYRFSARDGVWRFARDGQQLEARAERRGEQTRVMLIVYGLPAP
jgi:hypothetical protein